MNDNEYIEIATKSWYDTYFKFVNDNINKWNWEYLSRNSNITFAHIKATIDNPRYRWDWDFLSENPNITLDNVMETINDRRFRWSSDFLSKNPNTTFANIIHNINSDCSILSII